ncbi:MAG: HU family DNA-binding protein [Prevotella sp.]|nr:HU family DNA-binding protein [Prevotella sp.]
MAKIYQAELANVLVEKYGITRKLATQFVSNVVSVIQAALESDHQVKIKGLGSFKIVEVDARESVDVNTGERLLIEGHSKLVFVPDATMKELVNRPFSQFETVVLNEGVEFDDMNADSNKDADNQTEQQENSDVEEPVVEEEEPVVEEDEPVVEDEQPVVEDEEPVVEDEEPVVEDEQPVVEEEEPVVEDDEPVVEDEEPVVEDEQPVVEDEQPVVGDEQPVVEDEQPVVEDEQPVVEDEEPIKAGLVVDEVEEVEEEEPASRSHWGWWLVAVALAFAAGLGAGFYLGQRHAGTDAQQQVAPIEQPETPVAKPDTNAIDNKDTIVSTEQPVANEPTQAEQANAVPEWEKYNDMDPRTKNGFYYIMGLDRVEKVRKGENSKLIARRVFGAVEMACYIEVYNGIDESTELEEGADIRIPKIEPKKVVRRRLKQQQNN